MHNSSPPNGQTPQQAQQQYIQQLQQLHQQQQQKQDGSNMDALTKPPYPSVLNSSNTSQMMNPSGKNPQDRDGNVGDHVLLRETNEMGLRVTANPMAFEVEKSGAF